ncbi:ParB N-terminal domain-containing protein [Pseudoxanthomonas sp. 22568]|uniref:ParB N-terminal domain-containing protein n=1 Tax=Pseudoxanthomonas sp. 22568 TaxID=3453945 RepID=UPI003F85CE30
MTAIKEVPIDQLLLDPDNPRLPEDLHGSPQKQLIQHIARHEAVEDLMEAIGRNGFFPGEPLVVYRSSSDPKGKLRVIEGNRRLTSVKLLRNPGLYPQRPSLREIADRSPSQNIPDKLPVIEVASRDSALPYLGSRHIVGVKAWEPLPKARYMYQLFIATSNKKSPADRYLEVASRIGSGRRSDYVRKNLDALAVFNLIKKNGFYGDKTMDELSFSFGVLYTAIGDRKPIAGHTGVIQYDADSDTIEEYNDPIVYPGRLSKSGVADLYDWCFRSDANGRTVLGESRNLPELAAVLRSKTATKVLRNTRDLSIAYERSGAIADNVLQSLSRAYQELRMVSSMIPTAKPDKTIRDIVGDIDKQLSAIKKVLGI